METTPESTAAMNALERITLLSDLANAVKDEGVIQALKSRPSGEKLYDLFVQTVSSEIERLINPNQTGTKALVDSSANALDTVNRVGQVLAAIESSPILAILREFLQTIGELPQQQAPQRQQVRQQPQQQQAEQTQAAPIRSGRGTGLTW
jgi:hypothetical protein